MLVLIYNPFFHILLIKHFYGSINNAYYLNLSVALIFLMTLIINNTVNFVIIFYSDLHRFNTSIFPTLIVRCFILNLITPFHLPLTKIKFHHLFEIFKIS